MLTGEEILDSGVQVVAQPPGKRNTSIHLLSGGEKALTAISLVFALFQLNPAPFCLLDEVDAPLDDPNTERFCAMVREMSAQTQFLFISHNKITMEMANQLVGITMPEPGVSRVVAVDIAEALELARPERPRRRPPRRPDRAGLEDPRGWPAAGLTGTPSQVRHGSVRAEPCAALIVRRRL